MKRDANGVAVPDEESPLPWMYEIGMLRASDGSPVCEGMLPEDNQFVIHAANYHARLADILRRSVEIFDLLKTGPLSTFLEKDQALREDASALWDEMKGGGDEG